MPQGDCLTRGCRWWLQGVMFRFVGVLWPRELAKLLINRLINLLLNYRRTSHPLVS